MNSNDLNIKEQLNLAIESHKNKKFQFEFDALALLSTNQNPAANLLTTATCEIKIKV